MPRQSPRKFATKRGTRTPEALPTQLEPMLAVASEPFDSDKHLFEIKWDGTRCLAFIESGRLRLQNRRHIEMRPRYPELECLLQLPSGTLLDGEIVVLENGKPSFPKLQQREHLQEPRKIAMAAQRLPATLIAFDLLFLGGESLLKRPLNERRAALAKVVAQLRSPHVIAADHVVGAGKAYFAAAEKAGLEGIMAKRLDSPYQPGKRSPHWAKIKVAQTGVFQVLGFVRRPDELTVKSLIVGEPHGRGWHYKANVGSGLTEPQRKLLYDHLIDGPPLKNPPKDGPRDAVWRESRLRCAVRYFEKTAVGKLRAPVFVGMVRNDASGRSQRG